MPLKRYCTVTEKVLYECHSLHNYNTKWSQILFSEMFSPHTDRLRHV